LKTVIGAKLLKALAFQNMIRSKSKSKKRDHFIIYLQSYLFIAEAYKNWKMKHHSPHYSWLVGALTVKTSSRKPIIIAWKDVAGMRGMTFTFNSVECNRKRMTGAKCWDIMRNKLKSIGNGSNKVIDSCDEDEV